MKKRLNKPLIRLVCGLCLFALLAGLQKLAVLALVTFMLICGAYRHPWRV